MEAARERYVLGLRLRPRFEAAAWPTGVELLQAIGLAFALTLLARLLLPHVADFGGDDRHYVEMARNRDAVIPTPFAYRVLTPWLVQLLGTPTLRTFHVISLGFLALAGVWAYLITRGLGGRHGAGLVATFGLLTLRSWLFNIYDPWLADPAAMSLAGAAFVALVWGIDLLLPAVLVAWAMSREVWAGFVFPAYAWFRRRFIDPQALLRVAIVVAPAFIVMLLLFRFVPASGALGFGRLSPWVVRGVLNERLDQLGFWIPYAFIGSLGIWWLLAISRPRAGGPLWWWLVAVFGHFAVGTDWSRYALYAYVVIVPVGALAVWAHERRPLLLALVALQVVPTIADIVLEHRLKLNQVQPSVWLTAGLMAATLALLAAPRVRALMRRSLPEEGGAQAGT